MNAVWALDFMRNTLWVANSHYDAIGLRCGSLARDGERDSVWVVRCTRAIGAWNGPRMLDEWFKARFVEHEPPRLNFAARPA
jgi:hypothetical protein